MKSQIEKFNEQIKNLEPEVGETYFSVKIEMSNNVDGSKVKYSSYIPDICPWLSNSDRNSLIKEIKLRIIDFKEIEGKGFYVEFENN